MMTVSTRQHIMSSIPSSPSRMLVSLLLQPLSIHGYMLLSPKKLGNVCRLQLEISTAFISTLLQRISQSPTLPSSPRDPHFSAAAHPLAAILLLVMVLCMLIFPRRCREGLRRGACGVFSPSFDPSSDYGDFLSKAPKPLGSGRFDIAAVTA